MIAETDRRCINISEKLTEWTEHHSEEVPRILVDSAERSPYKSVGESKGPLDRINIRTSGNVLVDLKERSSVVAALKTYKLSRAYADGEDREAQEAIRRIVTEETN